MSEPVKPALTPVEWAHGGASDGTNFYVEIGGGIEKPSLALYQGDVGIAFRRGSGFAHAVAALALHGQPFGFTRDHLAHLQRAAGKVRDPHGEAVNEYEIVAMSQIAERIAALLPPEGT